MARIRSVKPGLFASYTLAQVPIEARYLYVGLWTEADDTGRLIDSPKRLAGAIFPHDTRVGERHVDGWLASLQDVGAIFRYVAKGGRYIAIPQWLEHQRISHPTPSQLPAPDSGALKAFLSDSGEVPE